MDISAFLAACNAEPEIQLSHFLCVSEDELLVQYAAPPFRLDTLRGKSACRIC